MTLKSKVLFAKILITLVLIYFQSIIVRTYFDALDLNISMIGLPGIVMAGLTTLYIYCAYKIWKK